MTSPSKVVHDGCPRYVILGMAARAAEMLTWVIRGCRSREVRNCMATVSGVKPGPHTKRAAAQR